MAKTKTYTVDNITPVAITVSTPCSTLTVYENNQAGTADYLIASPTSADQQITHPAGAKTIFTAPLGRLFQVGQVLGYLILASVASVTWAQEEN